MAAPWEAREEESAEAFGAFQRYRDAGPERSIRQIADEVMKDKSLLERWSARHDWVMRTQAWDRHLDDVRRAKHVEAVQKMSERQAGFAQALQGVGAQELQMLRKRMQKEQEENPDDPEPILSPETILRYIEIGSRVERAARGEPETISRVDFSPGDPLTSAIVDSQEVRDAAAELARRAAAAGASGPSGPGDRDSEPE